MTFGIFPALRVASGVAVIAFLFIRGFARRFIRIALRRGRVVVIVLAEKSAIPAERNGAQAERFAVLEFFAEYFRTEPDRKLVDGKAQNFRRDIMPKLVDRHHYEQYDDGQQYIAEILH